jgi:hypothetical protein
VKTKEKIMRIHLFVYIALVPFFAIGCASTSKLDQNPEKKMLQERQLFGTKVIINLNQDYSYVYEPIGYRNYRKTVYFLATDISERRMKEITQQIETYKSGVLTNGNPIYRIGIRQGNGWLSYYYTFLNDQLGETVLLTAMDTNDLNEKEIVNTFNTAIIKNEVDRNFNKAMFYRVNQPKELVPKYVAYSSIIYSLGDQNIDDDSILLSIGMITTNSGNIGNEKDVMKKIVDPNNSYSNEVFSNYNDNVYPNYDEMNIHGYCCTEDYEYNENDKDIKGKIAIILSGTTVYYLNIQSKQRNMDGYLENFADMLNSLDVRHQGSY